VAASRGDPHDTGRVPACLVRERLRQIDEQVNLRDRLGAVRHSGLVGAAKADFDVRLVLDAQVQGALAVLLGRSGDVGVATMPTFAEDLRTAPGLAVALPIDVRLPGEAINNGALGTSKVIGVIERSAQVVLEDGCE